MSVDVEVRSKLVEEANKALHRKGMTPAPCACSGRKQQCGIERIEEASDPSSEEKKATLYLSVACSHCGMTQFYHLPYLVGVDTFNKIAGDRLGKIV